MAIKNTWMNKEEEEKNQNVQSGALGSGGTGQPGTAAQNNSSWVNLQTYLDTNKGAGNAIARDTLANTNQEIDNTKNAISSWADQATKRAQSATVKDEWSDQIKNSSVADLNNIDKNKFQSWKQLSNVWGGAQDATQDQDYQSTFGKSQSTKDKIDNANTWQGQQQLARDAFGKSGRYSTGMGTLDAFVARGDAQDKFDQFQTNNANFGQNFTTARDNVNKNIGLAKDQQKANRDAVMNAISGRLKSMQGDLTTRADQANAAAQTEADNIKNSLRGAMNQEFNFDNIDRNKFISKAGAFDVADQAEIDALNTLAGLDDDASTGGFAKGSGKASFDWQGYQKEVDGAFSEWSKGRPKSTVPVVDPVKGISKDGTITTGKGTQTQMPTASGGSQAPIDTSIANDPATHLPQSGIPNVPMSIEQILRGGAGFDPTIGVPPVATPPPKPKSSGGGSAQRQRQTNRR